MIQKTVLKKEKKSEQIRISPEQRRSSHQSKSNSFSRPNQLAHAPQGSRSYYSRSYHREDPAKSDRYHYRKKDFEQYSEGGKSASPHREKRKHLARPSQSHSHWSADQNISKDHSRFPGSRREDPSRENPRSSRKDYNAPPNLIWREKQRSVDDSIPTASDQSRTRRPPLERNLDEVDFPPSPPPPEQTMEEIMEDLREVTMQYTSCADPSESAARKRRVLQSESKGLMKETAEPILSASQPSHDSPLLQFTSTHPQISPHRIRKIQKKDLLSIPQSR